MRENMSSCRKARVRGQVGGVAFAVGLTNIPPSTPAALAPFTYPRVIPFARFNPNVPVIELNRWIFNKQAVISQNDGFGNQCDVDARDRSHRAINMLQLSC